MIFASIEPSDNQIQLQSCLCSMFRQSCYCEGVTVFIVQPDVCRYYMVLRDRLSEWLIDIAFLIDEGDVLHHRVVDRL